MSFLDLDERLLEIAKRAELVKSPLVDAKAFPGADITLVEGAVATEEHLAQIREIREKTRVLVALGDCAVTGNVTRLRNFFPVGEVLNRSYQEAESNAPGKTPSETVSPLLPKVLPLSAVVKVDVHVPGCPPSADLIYSVLRDLWDGKKPDLGGFKYG
jgi:NAD-reducing hydrogenase small subunit